MAEQYWNHFTTLAVENRVLTGICATAILGVGLVVQDFTSWKAFGTGGTPPTWAGYWRMTKIRFNHALSSNDLLDTSVLSTDGPVYLRAPLPRRVGPRPKIVSRTMPQRQHPEKIDASTREKLQTLVGTVASQHPDLVETKPSHTEGFATDGLYAKADVPTLNPEANDKILKREIAHAHPAENSLHVWLSDPDARTVIEAGWGMRFPLKVVKQGWTMVYAPRNDKELEVVERIVRAGVGWTCGVET